MVVFPAPDGPTIAVSEPAGAVKEIPFNTSPLSTVSALATDSSDASEISSAFGYENVTLLNSMLKSFLVSGCAFGRLMIIGCRSRTSKTRSNETSAVITSIRTLDNAVSGP